MDPIVRLDSLDASNGAVPFPAQGGGPQVLKVVSALRPNGASAGTVSTQTY